MPTYTVEIPGVGTFDVESASPLTNEQAYQYALQSRQPGADEPPPRSAGTYESFYGGEGFGGATGRRIGAAMDAFTDIPESALGIVTGGSRGRLDAVLRTLMGVAAPFNITTAPIEAAVEQGAERIGVPENYSRLIGDVAGIGGAFGVGALAKAGTFGEPINLLAKTMGVGRPRGFDKAHAADALRRDPVLQFVAERQPDVGATELELAARSMKSTEELALELDNPNLARVVLGQKAADNASWGEFARRDNIVSQMPEEPLAKIGKDVILSDVPKRDWNFFHTLGTPATRAAATDRMAGAVAHETNLTEINYSNAIKNRTSRTDRAIEGMTPAEVRQTVIARAVLDPDQLANAPEAQFGSSIKNLAKFVDDKLEVDRQIMIPRLRDRLRPAIARKVRSEMGDAATESEMVNEVNKRVLKAIPDSLGSDEALLQIFPALYKVIDKNSKAVLKEANNGIEWKLAVQELVEGGMDPKNLDIDVKMFLDNDILARYKGRTKRNINHFMTGLKPTADEIEAAGRGEYIMQKPWKLFGQLRGESGARGYKQAFVDMLYTHDRQVERLLQVTDLEKKVNPMLKNLESRGYKVLADHLRANVKYLWGHRMPGSAMMDNLLSATPLIRDFAQPMWLERWSQSAKNGIVNLMLKFSPRFHAVNSTQLLQTLLPILDSPSELLEGIKLYRAAEGKALLGRHDVSQVGSKIEGFAKGLGPTEEWNQHVGFLTMYNRARKFGYSDSQAAIYGKLRGNLYSQMLGLATDQPMLFRKIDPTGLAFMFKRFPVKQMEIVLDLLKDKNLPGVGKWLGVNLALGGFKSASLGGAGWLTYKLYKDIENEYGKGVADLFHTGLPSIIGSDISGSVQLWDPPFGETFLEQAGNFAKGPLINLATSTFGAALDQSAVDPVAARRVIHAIADKNPLLKGLYQLFQDDIYDFRDTSGRLRWKADAEKTVMGFFNPDLMKTFAGLRPAGGQMGVMQGPNQMKPAELETFIEALFEMTNKRGNVLDYAASRYGAAHAAGVDLGKDMQDAIMKEVDAWNNLWPEFPITGDDILTRAKRRADTVTQGTAQRVTRSLPSAIKDSPAFAPAIPQEAVPPPPNSMPFEFFPGGG